MPLAPRSAARNISTYVWQLRKLLGSDRIDGRTGAYRIRLHPGELDAELLEHHVAAATQADDVNHELRHLEAACRLWRGTPYPELGSAAALEADRLRELHLTARADHADALLRAGRPAQAVALLQQLTAQEPLRERPWALLVRALRLADRSCWPCC